MRRPSEWKVEMLEAVASMPVRASMRIFISLAALLVKVTAEDVPGLDAQFQDRRRRSYG